MRKVLPNATMTRLHSQPRQGWWGGSWDGLLPLPQVHDLHIRGRLILPHRRVDGRVHLDLLNFVRGLVCAPFAFLRLLHQQARLLADPIALDRAAHVRAAGDAEDAAQVAVDFLRLVHGHLVDLRGQPPAQHIKV
jgi:hypothetical protein